ncbi:MAG: hypothetical protein ACE5IK_08750 [Acidobacteriota bacterium]
MTCILMVLVQATSGITVLASGPGGRVAESGDGQELQAVVQTRLTVEDSLGPIATFLGRTEAMRRTVQLTTPEVGTLTWSYSRLPDEHRVRILVYSEDEEFEFSVPFPVTQTSIDRMNWDALMAWEQSDTFARFAPIARRVGTGILDTKCSAIARMQTLADLLVPFSFDVLPSDVGERLEGMLTPAGPRSQGFHVTVTLPLETGDDGSDWACFNVTPDKAGCDNCCRDTALVALALCSPAGFACGVAVATGFVYCRDCVMWPIRDGDR